MHCTPPPCMSSLCTSLPCTAPSRHCRTCARSGLAASLPRTPEPRAFLAASRLAYTACVPQPQLHSHTRASTASLKPAPAPPHQSSSARAPPHRELRSSTAWPACRSCVCATPPVLTRLDPPSAPLLASGRSPPLGSCSCAHTPTPPVSAPCLLQRLFLPSSRAHPAPVPAHAYSHVARALSERKRTPALAQRPGPTSLAAACSRATRVARPRSAAHPAAACLLWPPLCSTCTRCAWAARACATPAEPAPHPAPPRTRACAREPAASARRPLGSRQPPLRRAAAAPAAPAPTRCRPAQELLRAQPPLAPALAHARPRPRARARRLCRCLLGPVEERERDGRWIRLGSRERCRRWGKEKEGAPGRRNRGEGGIELLQGLMRNFRKLQGLFCKA
jgi:hypothetical protein